MLLVATILVASCTKETKINSDKQSALKVEQASNTALAKPEQQLIFEMLSAEEKRTLWVNHLTNATLNNNFSPVQNTKIDELITMLTSSNPFEPANHEYLNYLKTVSIPNWETSVEGIFTSNQIYYLTSTFYPSYNEFETAMISATAGNGGNTGFNGGGITINCECNKVAGSSSDCPHLKTTIGTSPSIEITYAACPQQSPSPCTTTNWGCRVFWLWSCNGMCGPKP